MKIDITSMFFNSKIEGQTATPAWGTSIGQNKSRDCRIDDFKKDVIDMVVGMTYKSVTDLSSLDVSKGSGNRDIITCSVFNNVYINNKKIENAQYVLLLVREHSKNHDGRLLISYAPYIKYNGIDNQSCIDLMRQQLGCSPEGCWFVYDISIKNQSELYFSAVVVNASAPMNYSKTIKSKNRSEEWKALIPADLTYAPMLSDFPLQQIFYGAPGSGKSNTIKKQVDEKGEKNYRTTFHPDSDYSSFVGCYKPVMEDVETKVVPVVENHNATISCQSVGTFKEKKIVYKFVKQAFLKAYINAWKLFVGQQTASSVHEPVEVSYGIDTWIIYKVDENKAYYRKESHIDINSYKKRIQRAWNNGFKTDNYHETAAISWYRNNTNTADEEQTVEKCWEAVWNELKSGGTIKSKPGSEQEYSISLEGETILITAEGKGDGKGATKDTISNHFGKEDNKGSSVQKAIALKLEEYDEDFGKAWKKFEEEVTNSQSQEPTKFDINGIPPLFLVIEEINRGNCAQIFGDLFQLLDRKGGFSEYPIIADEDIRKCLLSKDTADDPSFGVDGLNFSDEQRNYINAIYSEGHDIANKIAKGEVLVLPPNLYIWATMNTSDQSLFPMDSAFKRRWSWKYVPIDYSHKDSSKFEIDLGDEKYSWPNFLRKINEEIKNLTYSEDKQMGNFFIKHSIGLDEFRDKVMFYLWSEIGKESYKTKDAIFFYNDGDKESQEFSFNELYGDEEKATKILKGFMDYIDKKYSDKFKDCSILMSEKKEQNQDLGSTPAVDSDEEI